MAMDGATAIIISSSDEEDISRSSRKSKWRKPAPRTNSKGPKKARSLGSYSRLCTSSSSVDEVRFSCEDFEQEFSRSIVCTGLERCKEELWVDKYKPHSLEELAVHKKKVEEVRLWFEERLKTLKDISHRNVLIVTGPAGVGKSVTVQVIASHIGVRLCEWSTPTPTIWQEHLHNSNSVISSTPYTSKLDEFNHFIERTRKYGSIPASLAAESKSPEILLIDDLPITNGNVSFARLKNSLHFLVCSTRIPTVVIITDYVKVDSTDVAARLEELQSSLESAGACKVAFNPVTVNCIKKTLFRICRQERCNVDAEHIDQMAKASGGDIRNAITSLQYLCLKPNHMKEKVNGLDPAAFSCGRDETLNLFHAFGKFLHNKRENEDVMCLDDDAFHVKENFRRLPLKMDPPEKILCQAHMQARPAVDFLHENVLDFLSDEAIDDAWVVASYLSDSDFLLASPPGKITRTYEVENLVQTVAASVAARGVLFGNSHPLPSRWHAVRRPKLWQIEQSSLQDKYGISRQKSIMDPTTRGAVADPFVAATEITPFLKWLGQPGWGGPEAQKQGMVGEDLGRMSLDEVWEDEIEEW